MRGLLAFLMWMAASSALSAACSEDRLAIRGDWGQAAFAVEVADTAETRAKGLMFREDMARFAGMLFIYERPVHARFWMKNTLIPLDILFADNSGTVTRIHKMAVPLDETSIDGGFGVRYVLEVNGGMTDRLGITEGSQIQHPQISGDPAWPCE